MVLLILYVALALAVSFLCSVMEAVLLSVTPSYVGMKEKENPRVGGQLRTLKQDIERPLATILSLNTIAHTVGATGAGAQAVKIFGDAYVGVISAVLTLLILVLSEIIPKTLGAMYWRSLAPGIARLLVIIEWPMKPFVWLAMGLTRLLSRGEPKASVSRAEMTALAEIGAREGVFEESESRFLKNLFRFRSIRVRDVMTPRTVIFTLPQAMTVGEVLEEYEELRFSRIPIFQENRDAVTGYVLKDEILLAVAQDKGDMPLVDLKRDILAISETLPLPACFERLMDRREHFALVVDEYGGTTGVVSMEDLVETLLGLEIVDEADSVDDMQRLAREKWVQRAKRLGLVTDDTDSSTDAERDATIRLGLTGGPPPKE
jgi:CBS domain containing-hemolysin-like protein